MNKQKKKYMRFITNRNCFQKCCNLSTKFSRSKNTFYSKINKILTIFRVYTLTVYIIYSFCTIYIRKRLIERKDNECLTFFFLNNLGPNHSNE